MNFLFVIDTLESGGAQKQLLNLSRSLANNGDKVVILVYNSNKNNRFLEKEFCFSGVKLFHNSKKSGFRFNVIRSIYSVISVNRFDCLVSILPSSNFYLTLTRIIYFIKIPQISWEMSIFGKHTKLRERIISYIANLFSNIVICNSLTQKKLLSKYPFLDSKLYFLSNGLNLEEFKNSKKYVFNKQKKILIVGRLSKPKNGINFVKGLELFCNEYNWCPKVTWVGRVDNGAESIYEKMNFIIDKSPLIRDNWVWAGVVKNIRPYYDEASCLVLPSKWEGVPNVIGEAMLYNCPVVATNVSDLPIILNHKKGLIINGYSPNAIKKSLHHFFSMPESQIQMSINKAKNYAVREFDVKKLTKNFKRIVKDLV